MLIFRTVCVTVRGKKSVFRLANEFAREGGSVAILLRKSVVLILEKFRGIPRYSRAMDEVSNDSNKLELFELFHSTEGTFSSIERRRSSVDAPSILPLSLSPSLCTSPRFESRIDRAMRDSPKIHLHTWYRKRVTR